MSDKPMVTFKHAFHSVLSLVLTIFRVKVGLVPKVNQIFRDWNYGFWTNHQFVFLLAHAFTYE